MFGGNIMGIFQQMMPGGNMPGQPHAQVYRGNSQVPNQSQQQQPQQQNVTSNVRANNPTATGIVSMNDTSMNINFPRIESNNNLNTDNPVTYE